MTQEADVVIILPDPFQNTIKIHMYQSGIFRIGALKKIGNLFFSNQNQKHYSKNGSKKLRGINNMAIRVITPKNAEFSSLNYFGHHEIDLYPKYANIPHFSILQIWTSETMAIWVSKHSK
jgi:hypothetical protein